MKLVEEEDQNPQFSISENPSTQSAFGSDIGHEYHHTDPSYSTILIAIFIKVYLHSCRMLMSSEKTLENIC